MYCEFHKCEKRNGTGRTRTSRVENGMISLNTCCSTLAKADIPSSVEHVLWNEELWKAKGCGQLSIHFCGDPQTVEVFFRTLTSVNQLSILVNYSSAWWAAINREWVTCGTWSEDTEWRWLLFLEPLTMVTSHRQVHGSVTGARAREQWPAGNWSVNCTSGTGKTVWKQMWKKTQTNHSVEDGEYTKLSTKSMRPNYDDARLFKLSRTKPHKKERNFNKLSTLPAACAGQSSHQLLLWLLGLCIPMRSLSALNCAGTIALM